MAESTREALECTIQNSPTRFQSQREHWGRRMVTPPTSLDIERQKLSKFTRNGLEDPMQHYKTCETIWVTNG